MYSKNVFFFFFFVIQYSQKNTVFTFFTSFTSWPFFFRTTQTSNTINFYSHTIVEIVFRPSDCRNNFQILRALMVYLSFNVTRSVPHQRLNRPPSSRGWGFVTWLDVTLLLIGCHTSSLDVIG